MTSRALLRALAGAGLEAAGDVGVGSSGPRPTVRDAEGRRWTVTALPAHAATGRAGVRRRVAALAGLRHPHVAHVAPLLEVRDGSAAVLQAEVPGPDLLTVCAARGPWSPGEVVTLVVPLAQALAAMHEVGVVHGDVAPANVVLRPDGRPVLVDLVCGAGDDEGGTPGLAPPERVPGVAATRAGDVHALARLGLALLEGAGACADDDPDVRSLRRVLTAATDADPAARPSAARLAADVYGACAAAPVAIPDAAVLARLTLRRLAAPPEAPTVRTTAGPTGRARHRRRGGVRTPVVVLATGTVLAIGAGALVRLDGGAAVASAVPGPTADAVTGPAAPAPAGPTTSQAGPGAADPATAAARLTRARVRSLAEGDPTALAAVTRPGSPAAVADRLVAARTWSAGTGPASWGLEVDAVEVLGGAPGGARRVAVTSRAWLAEPGADEPVVSGPERRGAPRSVVLVLVPGPQGWRVTAVEPPT